YSVFIIHNNTQKITFCSSKGNAGLFKKRSGEWQIPFCPKSHRPQSGIDPSTPPYERLVVTHGIPWIGIENNGRNQIQVYPGHVVGIGRRRNKTHSDPFPELSLRKINLSFLYGLLFGTFDKILLK